MLKDELRVDDCGMAKTDKDGAPYFLICIVKVYENGVNDVIKGRLREFYVPE